MSLPVKNTFFGVRIAEEIGETGRVSKGKPAPLFDLLDLKGNRRSIKTAGDRMILLHFWSSSCAPCITEAPELKALAADFERSLITINVSNDYSKEKWLAGIGRAHIDQMINVHDSKGKLFEDYAIKGIPAYYLISKTGYIVAKGSLGNMIDILRKK